MMTTIRAALADPQLKMNCEEFRLDHHTRLVTGRATADSSDRRRPGLRCSRRMSQIEATKRHCGTRNERIVELRRQAAKRRTKPRTCVLPDRPRHLATRADGPLARAADRMIESAGRPSWWRHTNRSSPLVDRSRRSSESESSRVARGLRCLIRSRQCRMSKANASSVWLLLMNAGRNRLLCGSDC